MSDIVRKTAGVDPAVCERLKTYRESLKLDQKAFAKRAGTAFRTYQDYEHGKSPPKMAFFQRLATLGADVTWLLTGVASTVPTNPWAKFTPDAELMGRITDVIAKTHESLGIPLSMVDLGRLSAEKYNEIAAATDDVDERRTMVKLIGSQLRNELLTAQPGSGKRSA